MIQATCGDPNALQRSFDRSPGCVGIVLWDDDGDLVAEADAEIGDTGEQDAVFASACFDIVDAVVLRQCADDLAALNWADLLVDKAAVVGDGEF